MAEQDRSEFERREPMDEDVIGRADDEEEFEDAGEEMDEEDESDEF
ncbi:MAG: hypothetical protein AB7P99_02470 [Vicinamibacterales bacterium]